MPVPNHANGAERRIQFSLRTLFVVMIAIAAFCTGWISKQRWDTPRRSIAPVNRVKARRDLNFLRAEETRRAQAIQKLESQIQADAADSMFLSAQLDRERGIQQRISERVVDLQAQLRGPAMPVLTWGIVASLSLSLLIVTFIAGLKMGGRIERA